MRTPTITHRRPQDQHGEKKMISLKKVLAASTLALAVGSALVADIPAQAYDKALAARVPEAIRTAGVLRNAVNGTFVPYSITKS